ncbi:BMS1 [Mytilus coruscus]|uniref:BMS1 n=1 Tax=Mytilus coruscus TaxID=42192 RepID=A0A6J8CM92_MYTCO|nr:BMS1 [Mytilus coruscus]
MSLTDHYATCIRHFIKQCHQQITMQHASGDFNLPDINWQEQTITHRQYPTRTSQAFLDTVADNGLEQIVDFQTHREKTLDLILTSHPSFKLRCKPLPSIGNSDHDIVLLDIACKPLKPNPESRFEDKETSYTISRQNPCRTSTCGPPKVGKTTLFQCIVKKYAKQRLANLQGPVTVVAGKNRTLTIVVVECNNDINAMIDLAKVADLVLLLVDASLGFEMDTFEFLNICQVHGFPRIMGVLTHLDSLKQQENEKDKKETETQVLDRSIPAHLFFDLDWVPVVADSLLFWGFWVDVGDSESEGVDSYPEE